MTVSWSTLKHIRLIVTHVNSITQGYCIRPAVIEKLIYGETKRYLDRQRRERLYVGIVKYAGWKMIIKQVFLAWSQLSQTKRIYATNRIPSDIGINSSP